MSEVIRGCACILLTAMLCLTGIAAQSGESDATEQAGPTLYKRLGGWDGIRSVVDDTIAYHFENAQIAHYLNGVDTEKLASSVTAFFAAGTGGPQVYEGRDMTTAHAHLGLSEADFDAAVSDIMKACVKNQVGNAEQEEVYAILYSLKDQVLGAVPEKPAHN